MQPTIVLYTSTRKGQKGGPGQSSSWGKPAEKRNRILPAVSSGLHLAATNCKARCPSVRSSNGDPAIRFRDSCNASRAAHARLLAAESHGTSVRAALHFNQGLHCDRHSTRLSTFNDVGCRMKQVRARNSCNRTRLTDDRPISRNAGRC